MKIVISREELKRAINIVKGIISSKVSFPILSNVLMEAENNLLKFSATDLRMSIEYTVDCNVEVAGALTLSGQRLSLLLNELPDADVTLELLENGIVELRCGGVETKLFSMYAEEFPPINKFDDVEPIMLRQAQLKKQFQKTSFAISTDQSRHNLTGLLLEARQGELRAVATDSRRLSLAVSTETLSTDQEIKVIIPSKMVHELQTLLSDDPEKMVDVFLAQSQACFKFDNICIITALIEGGFPNYDAVIPKSMENEIILELSPFIQLVRRATAMTNDRFKNARFTFEPGLIQVYVKTPEVGEYEEELAAEYSGNSFSISFNPFFLLDVLRFIETERVCMLMKDGGSPALIKPFTEAPVDTYVNVIMPIRN
ncbi:MAG: DNA polymerase III subunit beta [Candidatus Hydrogenedentes bacterium]|jgi:DNA polymerase-3 subunit beta|nr:DNA polymerase III subunit beta [Candidatus Hydrogenedentota bacterium]